MLPLKLLYMEHKTEEVTNFEQYTETRHLNHKSFNKQKVQLETPDPTIQRTRSSPPKSQQSSK